MLAVLAVAKEGGGGAFPYLNALFFQLPNYLWKGREAGPLSFTTLLIPFDSLSVINAARITRKDHSFSEGMASADAADSGLADSLPSSATGMCSHLFHLIC